MPSGRVWKEKEAIWALTNKQVKFTLEQPELDLFKYNYEVDYISANFITSISKTRNIENKSVKSNNCLYEKPVEISKEKKDDLMKLCKKGYIPKNPHGFYENVKCSYEND